MELYALQASRANGFGPVKQLHSVTQLSGGIENLISQKIESLPQSTRKDIRIAACLWDEVDETALSMVIEGMTIPDITTALESAATDGLVLFASHRGH